ncbi:MAG TPA: lysylphosphatidylglycerol synthase transmembrane domain-containing protein [Gaiellales bacterium]|nr:lysylphosphatidylglycerol synthase transmembrane domain-containing protein [Gaiellales bacterium]
MSRRTRVTIEAVISAVLIVAILQWAGIHRVLHELSRTQLSWFLPAIAVSVATVPVMALRWRLLLTAKGIDAPIAWLTRTYFVALFAGQFLPAAIGGDAVRAVELGRRTRDAPEAVASVLIDRLVGLVSLVVLALAAVIGGGGSARRPGVVAAEAAFGAAAGVALALLFSSRLRGIVARTLEPRPDGHRLAAGERFYDALHTYRGHSATLALVGALALVVQVARVGVIWLLVRALGLHVPDSVILLTGPVVFASLALPVSLNGIGVREGVFVYFLHGYAARPQAVALGLAFYAVGTITALGGAGVLGARFLRHGIGAVRPRTRIEGGESAPDLPGGGPTIPHSGDGATAPAERSTRA